MSIKPEIVERDKNGYWMHSQFPCAEVDGEVENWISEAELEGNFVFMQSDIDEDHPAYIRYFCTDGTDFHDWNPSKPDGLGWFIGGIYGAADGPVCTWLRPISEQLKENLIKVQREAEKAAYAYFCACEASEERIQASEIYERIRTATRIGG